MNYRSGCLPIGQEPIENVVEALDRVVRPDEARPLLVAPELLLLAVELDELEAGVLELKERKEQMLAIRLAHARSRAEEARDAAAEIERHRLESEAQLHAGSGEVRTVGSMRNASYLLEQLKRMALEDQGRRAA